MQFPLDHVMMRVEDLDATLEWYGDHLGYEEHGRWEADTFTNVFVGPPEPSDAGALLELTYNHDDRSYTMGDAWGHIAVRVRDVDVAYDELMAAGVEDYRDPDSCGGSYAFVKDPDGHEIELVEREVPNERSERGTSEGASGSDQRERHASREVGPRFSLDHTMVRVADADEAIGWYARKLGYDVFSRWEADTFANYHVGPSDPSPGAMTVELTYNYDGRAYEMGDAWGHLAVRTGDLHDAWETLMERDATDYRDPASCDDRYAFTTDADGHEIEVVTG